MLRCVPVVAVLFGTMLALSPVAQAFDLGGGAEFTSGLGLQGVGQLRFGSIALQGGIAAASRSEPAGEGVTVTLSGAYISLLAKYYFQLGDLPISAYLGAGAVGAAIGLSASDGTTTAEIFSGAVGGQEVVAGAELHPRGLPVGLYAGVNYINFSDLEVTLFGVKATVPVAASGFALHVGARLDITIGRGKPKLEEQPQ